MNKLQYNYTAIQETEPAYVQMEISRKHTNVEWKTTNAEIIKIKPSKTTLYVILWI